MSYSYGATPGGYSVGPIPTAPAQAYPMPAPYQPVYQPMRQTNVGKIVFWSIAGVIFAVCGLITFAITGLETGFVGLVLGGIFAIVPVPVIVLTAVWLSWAQPQPWSARIFALCWGAVVATLFALVFNTVSGVVIINSVGESSADVLIAVLVAPPVEETCKGLALVAIFVFSRFGRNGRYFTGPVDGITYALFAGAGFAFTENIAYLGRAYNGELQQSGMTGTALLLLLVVFAIRCVGTPFGHPLFTSATGVGLGIASRSNHHMAIRIIAPIIGWLVAMMLHGLFNLTASYVPDWAAKTFGNGDPLTTIIVGNGSFIVVLFPLFAIGVGVAIYARQSQFRVVKRGLPQYAAAGWIGEDEVGWLSTLRGRAQARKWAKQVAGAAGLGAMKEYQYAATRLAILRDGANRGQVPHNFTQTEQGLLAALGQQRKFFSPHAARSGGAATPVFDARPVQQYSAPPQSSPPYGQASAPPYGQTSSPPYGQPSAPPYGQGGGTTQSWQRPPN